MATISSLGTGSGLDLNTLLTNLMKAEQTPLLDLQKKDASYQARISSLGTLKSALSTLQTAATLLTPAIGVTASSKFSTAQATVADPGIASATADATAAASSYSLEVTSVARAQRLVTPAYGTGSSASTAIGTGSLKIEFGSLSADLTTYTADDAADSTPTIDRTRTITIDSSNNTLGGLRDAINASGADVSAAIVVGTAGAQLILTGKQTGLSSIMKLTMTDSVPASTTPPFTGFDRNPVNGGTGTLSETAAGGQVAANAAFTINGIAGSGTSNTITGMIEGVTLNLARPTTAPTTITVSKENSTKLTAALTSFITAYNSAAATMSGLGAYDPTTKVAGALQGDRTLRMAQSQLRSQLFNPPVGGTSSYQRLSDIGVSIGKDGTLAVDSSKLDSAINADFTAVANLVAGVGAAYRANIANIVGISGSISAAVSGANSQITSNHKSQERVTLKLTAIEARYRHQFASLDKVIAGMKGTSTYLTQQLESLSNLTASFNK